MSIIPYFVTCGAVIGDVSGSTLEGNYCKERPEQLITPYSHFTDDSVLTCAVAVGIQEALEGRNRDELLTSRTLQASVLESVRKNVRKYARSWPHAGYGGHFRSWVERESKEPYGSYGNGAPMRCAYAGWAGRSLAEAEMLGALSAEITHNHKDAMTAAAVVAGCIHNLRHGADKLDLLRYASEHYNFGFSLDALRPIHAFNITASGTVPVAIACFLESSGFADAIALADSMGGDTDTIAAITGSIAEAAYAVPMELLEQAAGKLDRKLREAFLGVQKAWLAEGNSLLPKPVSIAPLKPRISWEGK